MRILSFDIEEWFHILDNPNTRTEEQWEHFPKRLERNAERILDLLDETGTPATFFCLGWVAEKFPQVVRRISELGYEIASHSYGHQLAYTQTPGEFRMDLRRSLRVIEDLTGNRVNTYRVPGFSLKPGNPWVWEVLIEEGIDVDCSVFPARRGHGGFPQFGSGMATRVSCEAGTLKELPINVLSAFGARVVFSGGGYFRLLPYPALKRLFSRSQYVMTYFHPRDFDPGQPRLSGLSPVRSFKCYYGLGGAQSKLRRLLSDFEFVDVRTAVKNIDWESVREVAV